MKLDIETLFAKLFTSNQISMAKVNGLLLPLYYRWRVNADGIVYASWGWDIARLPVCGGYICAPFPEPHPTARLNCKSTTASGWIGGCFLLACVAVL